jgi:hypothetical protein
MKKNGVRFQPKKAGGAGVSTAGQSKERVSRPLGFAEMLRDILVASIGRGQFPVALLGLVALVSILKMPAADVSSLYFG